VERDCAQSKDWALFDWRTEIAATRVYISANVSTAITIGLIIHDFPRRDDKQIR